jgi:NitT/TauT family transport system substrate-binding protein
MVWRAGRHKQWRIFSLLAALLLAGCGQPAEGLRIGSNVWLGYEPLYLARTLGLLRPTAARLVEYSSATQVMDAFADGAIDAAALTLDEALLLHQSGLALRIVLVMDVSDGADALLARPPLDSLAALRGRRIGVEDTAVGAYLLDAALQSASLSIQDVRVAPLQANEHEHAYRSGAVDALVTFEPTRSRLLAEGARALFDSRRIPGQIMDVLAVRPEVAASPLHTVLEAWFAALAYHSRQPEEAAALMSRRLRLASAQVREAMGLIRLPDRAENRRLLATAPAPLGERMQALAKAMAEHGLAEAGLETASFLDKNLLAALYP